MLKLFIILLLAIVTAPAWATQQSIDPLVWKNETIFPEEGPTIWKAFPKDNQPQFDRDSTANRKNYSAKWEIKDNTLYLTSLKAAIGGKPAGIEDVFAGKKAPIIAVWWSGRIIIPRGTLIGLYSKEPRYIYSKETHIMVQNGKVTNLVEKINDPEKTPISRKD